MCQCARAAQAEQAEREWEDFEQEKAKRQWQAEEAASTPTEAGVLALAPPPAAVDMTPEAAEQAGELEAAKAAKAAKVAEGTEAATVLRATKQDPAEGGDEGGDGGEVEVGRAGAEGARAAQVGGGVSQVLVKTTWGIITVENVVSVTSVMELLRRKLGMPGLDGYLVHNGWRLAEERAPRECGIESSSTIHLYPRLLGGAAEGDRSSSSGAGTSSSGQARTSGQARAAEREEEAVVAVGCKRTRPDEGDGDDGWDNGSTAPPPAPPPSPAPAASVAAEHPSTSVLDRLCEAATGSEQHSLLTTESARPVVGKLLERLSKQEATALLRHRQAALGLPDTASLFSKESALEKVAPAIYVNFFSGTVSAWRSLVEWVLHSKYGDEPSVKRWCAVVSAIIEKMPDDELFQINYVGQITAPGKTVGNRMAEHEGPWGGARLHHVVLVACNEVGGIERLIGVLFDREAILLACQAAPEPAKDLVVDIAEGVGMELHCSSLDPHGGLNVRPVGRTDDPFAGMTNAMKIVMASGESRRDARGTSFQSSALAGDPCLQMIIEKQCGGNFSISLGNLLSELCSYAGKIGGKGKGVHELEEKIKELTAAYDECESREEAQRIEKDIKEKKAELREAQEKKSENSRKAAGKVVNHAAKGWSGGSGRKVLPCDARKERAACEKWCEDHPEYWSDEAKGVPAQCNKCEAKSALCTFAVRDQEEVRLIRRRCGTCAYARRSGELWPVASVPKGAMMSHGNVVPSRKTWKKAGS